MGSQAWQWRRLTDEQLEASAVKWVDRAGAAWYSKKGQRSEACDRTVGHILDEMTRRSIQLTMFEERPGYFLQDAS
jgi:hypothetical protein